MFEVMNIIVDEVKVTDPSTRLFSEQIHRLSLEKEKQIPITVSDVENANDQIHDKLK